MLATGAQIASDRAPGSRQVVTWYNSSWATGLVGGSNEGAGVSNGRAAAIRADVPRPSPVGHWTAPARRSSSWPRRARFVAVFSTWVAAPEKTLFTWQPKATSWGLDFVPVAIERAKAKAAERGINAHFIVGNALELKKLGQAVRHRDRLRPVPHLHRRGTPGVRQGTCRSPSAWWIAAHPLFLGRRAGDRGAKANQPSRKSETPSRWLDRFSESSRSASNRLSDRTGRSSALVAPRHGWRRSSESNG